MSSKDPPQPDNWDQLVNRALEEEPPRRASPAPVARPPQSGRRRLALLAAVVIASGAAWSLQREPVEPTPEQLEQGRRAALLFTAARVEAYMRAYHRLPERLDEVMPIDLRVTYRRAGDGAILEVHRPEGEPLRRVVRPRS